MGNISTGLFRDRIGSQRQQVSRNYQFMKDKNFQVRLMKKKFEMEKELLDSQKEDKPKSAMGSIFAGLAAAGLTLASGGTALPALLAGAKAGALSEISKSNGGGELASALSSVVGAGKDLSQVKGNEVRNAIDMAKFGLDQEKFNLDKTKQETSLFSDIAGLKKIFTDESVAESAKSGNALLLKKRNEAKDFSPSNFTTIVNSLMTTQFMSLDEAKTSAVDLFSSVMPGSQWTKKKADSLSNHIIAANYAIKAVKNGLISKEDAINILKNDDKLTTDERRRAINSFKKNVK